MTLRIHNTLTRKKEEFKPLDPSNVRMYVCGPTVYDFAHIGNARPAIVFDVLYRLLRHTYGADHVKYVRNITDVDDKINARALRDYPGTPLNEAIRKVTEKTYDQYQKDVSALGCLPPNAQPRATEHIEGMVEMISTLINRGHAYEAAGEVLFDTGSMKDYGALSGRKMEDQLAGARVAVDAHKKNPGDFVLWKQSEASEPGWESPWGRGRPGWHIECSVMSKAHLGEVFDIHGGGLDLIFPHHENEIAQSRCAHGSKVMANYWMHNGFLQVEGEKMSKSLGNFITIADVLQNWGGEIARFNMLKTHYRQPIDWTQASMEDSYKTLRGWQTDTAAVTASAPDAEVIEALSDDLNSHAAFTRLHQLAKQGEFGKLKASLDLLGFTLSNEALRQTFSESIIETGKIDELVTARIEARKAKNFAESDRIRDELVAMGIEIQDAKDPATGELKTEWKVKR
ncbi:cysteine--tRNA ligase [Aestuariivirga litoralis]|uniref:cysteine--tRNA ligase n=1 Tax=Aestuariivirga litoralis TaxID=2650924 RepID=UPI0018C77F7C|nr:cysteine--tRNA ligase [Aestuariivirga litoralis]MBG1232081.1 cysteine--tRNA ligase [Aestuariivirga litoralis]